MVTAAFTLTLQAAVWGYHVYQVICTTTVGFEFDYQQEPENEEDKYAVTVYGDSHSSDVLGDLPREILHVYVLLLECAVSITSSMTDRR